MNADVRHVLHCTEENRTPLHGRKRHGGKYACTARRTGLHCTEENRAPLHGEHASTARRRTCIHCTENRPPLHGGKQASTALRKTGLHCIEENRPPQHVGEQVSTARRRTGLHCTEENRLAVSTTLQSTHRNKNYEKFPSPHCYTNFCRAGDALRVLSPL